MHYLDYNCEIKFFPVAALLAGLMSVVQVDIKQIFPETFHRLKTLWKNTMSRVRIGKGDNPGFVGVGSKLKHDVRITVARRKKVGRSSRKSVETINRSIGRASIDFLVATIDFRSLGSTLDHGDQTVGHHDRTPDRHGQVSRIDLV